MGRILDDTKTIEEENIEDKIEIIYSWENDDSTAEDQPRDTVDEEPGDDRTQEHEDETPSGSQQKQGHKGKSEMVTNKGKYNDKKKNNDDDKPQKDEQQREEGTLNDTCTVYCMDTYEGQTIIMLVLRKTQVKTIKRNIIRALERQFNDEKLTLKLYGEELDEDTKLSDHDIGNDVSHAKADRNFNCAVKLNYRRLDTILSKIGFNKSRVRASDSHATKVFNASKISLFWHSVTEFRVTKVEFQ